MESCKPVTEHVYPGHALRQQGNQGEFFSVFPSDKPTVFVDVLVALLGLDEWESDEPTGVEQLHLCYVQNLLGRLPVQELEVVLRVEGGNASRRKTFKLAVVGNQIHFQPLDKVERT
jgi:hypothetical protein